MEHYDGPSKDETDLQVIAEEYNVHKPYVLLEQMAFQYGALGGMFNPFIACEYEKMQKYFGRTNPIDCMKLPVTGAYFE